MVLWFGRDCMRLEIKPRAATCEACPSALGILNCQLVGKPLLFRRLSPYSQATLWWFRQCTWAVNKLGSCSFSAVPTKLLQYRFLEILFIEVTFFQYSTENEVEIR